MALDTPFILTLKLDKATYDRFETLRQDAFPAARNVVPAHVSLFHALPSDNETLLHADLDELASAASPLPLVFPSVFRLGRGVAVRMHAPELVSLHRQIAQRWWHTLSAQDRQPYHPHITVQNKAQPERARELFERMSQSWQPLQATGEGLLLWRYMHGPWEYVTTFPFSAPVPAATEP